MLVFAMQFSTTNTQPESRATALHQAKPHKGPMLKADRTEENTHTNACALPQNGTENGTPDPNTGKTHQQKRSDKLTSAPTGSLHAGTTHKGHEPTQKKTP